MLAPYYTTTKSQTALHEEVVQNRDALDLMPVPSLTTLTFLSPERWSRSRGLRLQRAVSPSGQSNVVRLLRLGDGSFEEADEEGE